MANADPITGSGVLRREWRGLARLVLESFAAGIVVSVALALAVFIVTTPAHAAGSDAGHGTLYLKEGNGNKVASPLLFTDVHMDVSGMIARVQVKQRFVNPTAEWREGVWIRPDNLLRQPDRIVAEQCTFFSSRYPDPLALVSQLWDLPGWAREARRLCAELDGADGLTAGFMATAKVIRHLLIDPYLPAELLPADWPGEELRERYAEFSASYAQRLRDYSGG